MSNERQVMAEMVEIRRQRVCRWLSTVYDLRMATMRRLYPQMVQQHYPAARRELLHAIRRYKEGRARALARGVAVQEAPSIRKMRAVWSLPA